MQELLWVCLGSALGGGARHLLGQAALALLGAGFPWGTLAVNVLGCFGMGLLAQFGMRRELLSPAAALFLSTGLLGGFTTYSSFNHQTLQLAAQSGSLAALYVLATLLGCLLAGALGAAAGRALLGAP